MRKTRSAPIFSVVVLALMLLVLFAPQSALAVTYANISYPFSWIDASTHNRLGAATAPYKMNGGGNCGTNPPIIDDTISDLIPIGFTFAYGGVDYTNLRVSSNGRIQLGNNNFCGYGTANVGPPQTYPYRYPDANPGASMRIYGADLDPTPQGTAGYTTSCVAGNCYLSYALVGTAPYRSFVVTWNNVPEWIGSSKAGGNFNLQIILQENGEFIYQYGVNVHGASGTAEIGWQVSTADYDVPGFGLPVNNSAIKFYIPRPVAEYRMEQSLWNGTASEVIDSSGNARHGVRLGTANTIASGRVCRGADIPSNTTLAAVAGIQTPVNVSTAVGGQGTITFWYRSDSNWNAGNSDRQLFDASEAGSRWFFLTKRTNGRLRFVLSDTAGTARALEVSSNNTTAAGTWRHVAVTWNFNALAAANSDRMRIYIDGVQVAQSAFSTNETLFAGLANLVVGDNRNIDSSAQNGSPKSADGTIDEFRIYNFEGGVGLIQRDMAANACLGHYAISAVAGSTCQPTQVTVTAHNPGDTGTVTMPNNTTMITLSNSTNQGDWSLISGYGTFNNGAANDGIATYVFNGEYQAVFGYQTNTSGNVNFNVSDGQLTELEDPTVTVGACSVKFNACELMTSRCNPPGTTDLTYARLRTKLASTAFVLDTVAVDSSNLLNGGFNGTVKVDLLANTNEGVLLSGNNCPSSQTAVIPLGNVTFASGRGPGAGVAVAANAFSNVSPNYAAYRDVRVRFTCDSTNCSPSGVTACSSDNFAVRPTNFMVSSTMNNTARTGTPKLAAGADFTLTATAVAGYNGAPQIDRRANPPACSDVLLPNSNKVQDHDGVCIDRLYDTSGSSVISFSAANAVTGSTTGTFQYHDVGNFRIAPGGVYDSTFTSVDQPSGCVADSNANVADANGLFGCNVGNTAATAYFGRFYVDHFAVTAGSVIHGCAAGNYTYMAQPALGLNYTIQAQSQSRNLVTRKYTTASYLPVGSMGSVDLIALNGISGTALTARMTGWTSPNTNWVAGEQTVAATALALNKLASPDGPFANLTFGARVQNDQDGAVIAVRNMLNTGAACAGNACTHAGLNIATPAVLRFGRARLQNATGSELLPLPLGLQLQYWAGATGWQNNAEDTCTTIQAANFAFAFPVVATNRLAACETALTLTGAAPNYVASLAAPGGANPGWTDITLNLGAAAAGNRCTSVGAAGPAATTANAPWLQFNWTGVVGNPLARATFGVYNAGPIIHRREMY